MIPWRYLGWVVLWATVGGALGWGAAHVLLSRVPPPGSEHLPYPHVVPKSKDGVALRFAMVHDVLHERLPRHSQAYYKERNRRARLALKHLSDARPFPWQKHFSLLDDLG